MRATTTERLNASPFTLLHQSALPPMFCFRNAAVHPMDQVLENSARRRGTTGGHRCLAACRRAQHGNVFYILARPEEAARQAAIERPSTRGNFWGSWFAPKSQTPARSAHAPAACLCQLRCGSLIHTASARSVFSPSRGGKRVTSPDRSRDSKPTCRVGRAPYNRMAGLADTTKARPQIGYRNAKRPEDWEVLPRAHCWVNSPP